MRFMDTTDRAPNSARATTAMEALSQTRLVIIMSGTFLFTHTRPDDWTQSPCGSNATILAELC